MGSGSGSEVLVDVVDVRVLAEASHESWGKGEMDDEAGRRRPGSI